MDAKPPKPVVSMLAAGGYQVHFPGQPDITGSGATISNALQHLSAKIVQGYSAEKAQEVLPSTFVETSAGDDGADALADLQ